MNNQEIYSILVKEGIIPDTQQTRYNVPCCFHQEKNGKSLSISFDEGLFRCFSPKCSDKIAGSLNWLVHLLGYNVEKNEEQLNELVIDRKIIENSCKKELQEFDIISFQKYHNMDCEYLVNRGFEDWIIKGNKCSYSNYFKRVYIPIWNNGICLGYSGRTVLSNNDIDILVNYISKKLCISHEEARYNLENEVYDNDAKLQLNKNFQNIKRWKPFRKYKNMYGLAKDSIVFEPLTNNKYSDYSVVVEGQLNALMANQFGCNAYAIMGSHPTEQQVQYILDQSVGSLLILVYDNDQAGINNTKMFREIACKNVSSFDWDLVDNSINDINDLNQEQFAELLLNRRYL